MKLPGWASRHHPVVLRDLRQWRIHRRSLGWLWVIFLLPPLASPFIVFAVFTLLVSSSGGSLSAIEPEVWGAVISGSILLALWSLQAFMGWGLAVFAVVGAASTVARERETLNWSMLRLTLLDIPNILNAKLSAVLRWLAPATLALLLLRIVCVIGLVGFVLIWRKTLFSISDDKVADLLIICGTFLPLFAGSTLTDLIYTCAISALASTIFKSSAQTLALAFGLLLLLWLFIFLPVQRGTYMALSDFFSIHLRSVFSYSSPYPAYLAAVGAFYIAPILMQLGLSGLAYLLARAFAPLLSE
jgi:hypothetical protein